MIKKLDHMTILLILFIWSPLQNFILPFLYTSFGVPQNYILALILFKELLMAAFFVYLLIDKELYKIKKIKEYPLSIQISFLFLAVICIYSIISLLVYRNQGFSVRQARQLIFPFEAIIIGFLVSLDRPQLKKLIKVVICLSVLVSIYGIFEVTLLQSSFYIKYLNIAQYNHEVKGDARVIFSQGISGSAQGRAFLQRRLFSTYGDPLSFGMANVITLLLSICYFIFNKKKKYSIFALIIGIAILFTFSRSSWILVAIALVYISIRKSKYVALYGLGGAGIGSIILIPKIREFVLNTITLKKDVEHQVGFVELYRNYLFKLNYFFGKGIKNIDWVIENGYLFIFYQLGYIGLILYFVFLYFVFKDLTIPEGTKDEEIHTLTLVLKGILVGTFFTTNFSHYSFTFNHYLYIWIFCGIGIQMIYKD